jgi:hypothetical protein
MALIRWNLHIYGHEEKLNSDITDRLEVIRSLV